MRLREVFAFELGYRLRSASTWIYAGILFLIAVWMFLALADGGTGAHFNAPERLAGSTVQVGIFGMLISAALFGDAAVRDIEVGMQPLLFTSPLRKLEYLGGRFCATLAVNAVLVVVIPLGLFTATLLAASFETVGPLRIGAYLQPFFIFSLPNLVVVGAILFTIGTLARHVVPVYLGAIGIFIGYVVALNYPGVRGNALLTALTDPSGMGVMQELTKYWTEAEKNTRLLGLPVALVWNRAIWLAIAAALFAVLLQRFRFAHLDGEGRRRKAQRIIVEREPASTMLVTVPRVAGTFEGRTRARQMLAIARTTLEEVAGGRAFIAALAIAMGLTLLWGWNVGDSVFDTSVWPVTHLVADVALSVRNSPIIYLLIAIYAGEMVWKDRDTRVAEIVDALPVPEWVALVGRFLALVAILAVFQGVFMLAGVLIQTLQGYHHLELGLYLRMLFGLKLANYVLVAALALTIHVLVNHKYLGHIVVLLAVASTVVLPQLGIARHHLLLYGTDPGWTYSDMNGFGPFVAPFVWFKLYWAAWALLLIVLANLFWVRGREPGLRRRLGVARARFAGSSARTAGIAIALIVALGGFVFFNTNVVNEYRTREQEGAPQAEYEKRYKRFENTPQPTIESADLRLEIYPDEPAADLSGTFQLVNRTGAPIDSVHVLTVPEIETRTIGFDRPSKSVLVDDERRYRIYALDRPLEPGDSLRLTFDVSFRPRGFRNSANETGVVANGTRFDRRWLPIIGYQPSFELGDLEARERFGLGAKSPIPGPDDVVAKGRRELLRDADRVHVKTLIGTNADQIGITPGVLQRSWTENARSYFEYETAEPVSFGVAVFCARYAVVEDRWHDVALRIYHHPAHDFVLDSTFRSMKAALDYMTEQFGPYADKELRIVEFPRYGGFGISHPQTIGFSEENFISNVKEGEIDQPFYGTAHEIAHHWWGGQARGAMVRGNAFLSESLANYSAMMIMEKAFGPAVARRVYEFQMDRYFLGRANQSREVAVLDVEDQAYIAYRRGALALYTLREQIGEEPVNAALRRYLEKYHDAAPPYPTSRDLYAELRAITPDALQPMLSDLFEKVTLWDVRTQRAHVEPTNTGEYRVTLDVVAKKLVADSAGSETEVPMDELVDIGVFAPGAGDELGAPLYLERQRITSGAQTISINVKQQPARAGIDPYRKLFDREREDNVAEVKSGTTSAALVRASSD